LEVEYEVVLFLPYKQVRKIELNVWPLMISCYWKFRNEMIWLSYCDVGVIFDIDKTHMVERLGFCTIIYSELVIGGLLGL
jgi:hypothetical protein